MTESLTMNQLVMLRHGRKLTQAEMARRLGTAQSYLSNIENGHNKCSLRRAEQYARALGAVLLVLPVEVVNAA